MNNNKIFRLIFCAMLFGAFCLLAEEPEPTKEEAVNAEIEAPETEEVSEEELQEVLGYITAMRGSVASLKLDESGVRELAGGLQKALAGKLEVSSLEQSDIEAAFGEARARVEAVQADKEELPAFSPGALEKIGAVISVQSGLHEFGFDDDAIDAIRAGFIEGADATEMDPEVMAKMPAFQSYMQQKMEQAQAAMKAEQEKAKKAAMAEFESISKEWSQKENINVVLETTQGDVEIELFPKHAPLAVANFVGHIKSGYYDGLIFHRVIDGFMIQGGDPLGTGTGGESIWDKPFPDEFTKEQRFDEEGLLAMANSGPMTNGSQFFITTSKPQWLNDKHTIFGQVVEGYENVQKIEKTETGARDKPVEEQKIVKAYVKE